MDNLVPVNYDGRKCYFCTIRDLLASDLIEPDTVIELRFGSFSGSGEFLECRCFLSGFLNDSCFFDKDGGVIFL